MPILDADETSQLLFAGDGPYLVVNNDVADTVYLSQARRVSTSDMPLAAQASVQLAGPWYVSTLSGQIVVQVGVLPGSSGGYSNPVGVQIALAALGLAKDSTLTGGLALAQPAVPNMRFAAEINQGPGTPIGIVSSLVPYRLWGVWISYAVGASAAYVAGLSQFSALLADSLNNDVLTAVELALLEPSQIANDGAVLQLPGLPFAASQNIYLNVNNGTGPANTNQRCSAGAMYSVP